MLNKDYKEMLQLLSEESVKFIVVGAYALAAHGFPRATGDIDIWIEPEIVNANKVIKVLKRFGCPLYSITIDDLLIKGTVFQIGVAPRRIDIVTAIDGVEFNEAWDDCIKVIIEGIHIPVLSLDKLIKNKESTGREKDVLDLKNLMQVKEKKKVN